jgi:hypothetical protein
MVIKCKLNLIYAILFIAFLTLGGCSKSSKNISAQELADINNSLIDYMFLKRHFDEPDRIWAFLQKLAILHYDSFPFVASGGTLWKVRPDDISSWLKAKEKSEDVFKKLCSDPQLKIEGNNWKVVFNVFKKDGSVDKWQVEGEHYPPKKYNQVKKIEIMTLKPQGTFFCPMMG